jgi:hypothetical protein
MHWLMAACSSQSINPYNIKASDINAPCSTPTLGDGIVNIIHLLMAVMGGLALIFIIVGGIQMVLSAGDSGRVKRARDTILYAAVGLVVAIAAYAIVSFISTATGGGQ